MAVQPTRVKQVAKLSKNEQDGWGERKVPRMDLW